MKYKYLISYRSALSIFSIAICTFSNLSGQTFLGATRSGGVDGGGTIFRVNADGSDLVIEHEFLIDANPGANFDFCQMAEVNGNLYGVTPNGGRYSQGILFEYNPATNTYTKKADFHFPEGANPFGRLVLLQGKLYGMTQQGGANGRGVIFEYDLGSNQVTKKIDFDHEGNGSHPYGGLTLASNGKMYGLAYGGGINAMGVLFEYDPAENILLKKFDFDGAANGSFPIRDLTLFNGKLYGLAVGGGSSDKGVLFEFDPSSGAYAKKIDFDGTTQGGTPIGSLTVGPGNILYGTNVSGGAHGFGVLFEYSPVTGVLTKVIDFDGVNNGKGGINTLTEVDDKLYGTSENGGVNDAGVLFEFDPDNGTLTKKMDFGGEMGVGPKSGLTLATNGKLYGTTAFGGLIESGVLFEYDPADDSFVKKIDMNIALGGRSPENALVRAANGKFYGVAPDGGSKGWGILFEYDAVKRVFTKKIDFNDLPQGANPFGNLCLAPNGKLYGTTYTGGLQNYGVLFEYDPETNIYVKKIDFEGPANGANAHGGLTLVGDKLYGMTRHGGTSNLGTLFSFDLTTEEFEKKVDFSAGDGEQPMASVTRATNGRLYGMTSVGGTHGYGVLFEFNPANESYEVKVHFDLTKGSTPTGSLILADDNMLYGLTSGGGEFNGGVLFRFDPATGAYETRVSFTSSIGVHPLGTLAMGEGGKLYGTTSRGGEAENAGTFFEYDPAANVITTKIDFNGSNGAQPGMGSMAFTILPPEALEFTSITPTSFTGSFADGDALPNDFLVLMSEGEEPTLPPTDGVVYPLNQVLGNAYAVYSGSAPGFNVNVSAEAPLYFHIYPYTGSGNAINYFQGNPLTGYIVTPPLTPTSPDIFHLFSRGLTWAFSTDHHLDAQGNYYLTGSYFEGDANSKNDLDPGSGVTTLPSFSDPSPPGTDLFIAKYSGEGNLIWAKGIGSDGTDSPRDIHVDGDGNVYVAGIFDGASIDLNPDEGTFVINKVNSADAFVVKLNSSGNFLTGWEVSSAGYDEINSVATDLDGNIYTTGQKSGSLIIEKRSQAGTVLFYNELANGVGRKILLANNETSLVIIGAIWGPGFFDPGTDAHAYNTNGAGDILLGNYDPSNGNYLGNGHIYGSAGEDYVGHAEVVNNTNILLTGSFHQTIGFGATNLASKGQQDVFLARFNENLQPVWIRQLGGPGNDTGTSLAVAANNDIYLLGNFEQIIDLDPGDGSLNKAASGGDFFVVKMNSSGTFLNGISIEGNDDFSSDLGVALSLDSDGDIYLAVNFGQFNLTDVDPTGSVSLFPTSSGFIKYTESVTAAAMPEGQPSTLDFSILSPSGFRGTFTAPVTPPDGYLVLMAEGAFPDTDPTDGIVYPTGTHHNNAISVFNANATSFDVQNINPRSTYYFKIYSYRGNAGSIRYLKDNPLTGVYSPGVLTFSPQSGEAGTTVTIGGPFFDPIAANNHVYFGASKGEISFASATELQAIVPGGTTYEHISVTTNGFTSYTQAPFNLTFDLSGSLEASFFDKTDLRGESRAARAATGDLNQDGKPDVIMTDSGDGVNKVFVFTNTSSPGSMSFGEKIELPGDTRPYSVAVADLDNDGWLDLAVANYSANNVSVFRNTSAAVGGSISFAQPVNYVTGGSPSFVSLYDVDRDGRADIATGNSSGNSVSILKNLSVPGAISFSDKVDFPVGGSVWGMAFSDLDDDGRAEMVVADLSGGKISLFKNTGSTGSIDADLFEDEVEFTVGPGTISGVCMADLDRDGIKEVIVAGGNDEDWHNVSVFKPIVNAGDLSLERMFDLPTTAPWSLAISDINGDGKPDVIAGNISEGTVTIFENASSAGTLTAESFAIQHIVRVGGNPLSISPGDMDGDGITDLTIANEQSDIVSVYRNFPDESPPQLTSITASALTTGVALNVTAGFSDDQSGVESVFIYHRSVSAGEELTKSEMDLSGENWIFSIPSTDIGELGVEYKVEATNGAGLTYETELTHVKINLEDGVEIPYSSFGTELSNYRIISVPLDLSTKSVNDVFADDLGIRDPKKWRVARWENGSTNQNYSGNIVPGQGYWLIVRENPGEQINSGSGTTVTATETGAFSINLSQGWNQIGNPYNFDINWQDLRDANPTLNLPENFRHYRTGTFGDANDEIRKMEGVFINTSQGGQMFFPVRKNPANNGRKGNRAKNPLDSASWEVYFKLTQGKLSNLISGFGMHDKAAFEFDIYDGLAMPRFDDFLELHHAKSEYGFAYSKDIVPTSEEFVWEFSIVSSSHREPAVLAWDNTTFGQSDKSLILWDVGQERPINMRLQNTYEFDSNLSGRFKVFFGSIQFVNGNMDINRLMLHDVYPNPVPAKARISFSVPTENRTMIEIVDMTGRRSELVFDDVLSPGHHELEWKPASGAVGLFIMQIKSGSSSVQKRIMIEK